MPMITIDLHAPKAWTEAQLDAYERMVLVVCESVVRAEIVRLATEQLRSTQEAYIQAIQPAVYHMDTALIRLDGVLPNMVELGWAGGDLRETALKMNAKAKRAKDGHLYASIPFGHKRSGMPPVVVKVADVLKATGTAPGGKKTIWGDSLDTSSMGLDKLKPHHVTDIFAGMYRNGKVYQKGAQGEFVTFRTISERTSTDPSAKGNRHPSSWIHPGIQARHFFDQAGALLERYKDDIVAAVPLPGG